MSAVMDDATDGNALYPHERGAAVAPADPIESARASLSVAHDTAAAALAALRAERTALNRQIAALVAQEQQLARSLSALTRPKRTRTKATS